ncbi:MAG: tellurite resistance TerB family protein [Polyangiaceae bacterium]|nr:tellurite resistance TerB family protein [Polyangiaceae bacterium]
MQEINLSRVSLLEHRPSVDEIEALIEVALLVAFADGNIAPQERERIARALNTLLPGTLGEDDRAGDSQAEYCGEQRRFRELLAMARPEHIQDADWREERLQTLASRLGSTELREAAFTLSVEVAHIDQGIGLREGSMLVLVAQALQIDLTRALQKLRQPL